MKILALDGGGVFGRVQARILAEANCFDKFDAFAGTSIGSPQILAMALGKSYMVGPEFFDKWMAKVFRTSWFRKINIFQSEYPDTGLNEALRAIFGSSVLGDVKKPVFITAANIGQKTLKVFSSTTFDDQTWPCWEVCRAATAAETYFPSWKGFADGGIYANNPSMVALVAAVRTLNVKLEDIEILSIGTGRNASDGGNPPGGRLTTALWVLRAMLNGSANDMHEYFVKSLPIKRFIRIQFGRNQEWKMDNPKDMYRAERQWAVEIIEAIKTVKAF
jgi:patatin-like phospholipase/acyl hydrolase